MPTYEYKCADCGNIFEEFQSITAEPIKNCPACGGAVQRLIGAGNGLIFKGSGFYITDYKNNKGKREPKPAEKKNETNSDKKAAA